MTETTGSAIDILLDQHEQSTALSKIESPDWGNARSRGDWKGYVVCSVRDAWQMLSTESRLVAYITARNMVRSEP